MSDQTAIDFGLRLRELREQQDLTQKALADRVGLHLMELWKIELGQREPKWGTVPALADALGVGVEAFAGKPSRKTQKRGRGRPAKRRAGESLKEWIKRKVKLKL
jgi:transcriptional regulator with XRE-family HTH domain